MKKKLKVFAVILSAVMLSSNVYAADEPVMDDIPIDNPGTVSAGSGSGGDPDTSKVDGIQIGPDASSSGGAAAPSDTTSSGGGQGSGGSDEIPTIVLEPDYSKVEVPKPAPQPQKPAQTPQKPAQNQTPTQNQTPVQNQTPAQKPAQSQVPAQNPPSASTSGTGGSDVSKEEQTSSAESSSKESGSEEDDGVPKVEISESDWVDIKVSDTLVIERGNRFMKPLAMIARSDFSVTNLYAADLLDKLGAPGGSNKTDE